MTARQSKRAKFYYWKRAERLCRQKPGEWSISMFFTFTFDDPYKRKARWRWYRTLNRGPSTPLNLNPFEPCDEGGATSSTRSTLSAPFNPDDYVYSRYP